MRLAAFKWKTSLTVLTDPSSGLRSDSDWLILHFEKKSISVLSKPPGMTQESACISFKFLE